MNKPHNEDFIAAAAGKRLKPPKDHFWHDPGRVRALLRCEEPCDPSELAGFFDGDGCFYNAKAQVGCGLTQCHYPTLRRIQECFGGIVHKRSTKHKSLGQRYQYTLMFRGIEITAIVPIIKDHLVLKGSRATRALETMSLYNKTDAVSREKRLELARDSTDAHAFDRINKNYIRGLFCAEGCLKIDTLSICQKGCPDLLRAIQAYIGAQLHRGPDFGKIDADATKWLIHKQADIVAVLDWLTDANTRRLFHEEKAAQIDAFYAYIATKDKRHAETLTALKHVDCDVSEETLRETNQAALQFTAALRSAVAGRAVAPNKPKSTPLTAAQQQLARELLEDGALPLAAIGARVGCTKGQISYLKKTSCGSR